MDMDIDMETDGGEEGNSTRRGFHLNLPVGMNRSNLVLDTDLKDGSGGNSISRAAFFISTPSPSSSKNRSPYSDRFIPSRSGSNFSNFHLIDKSPASASNSSDGNREESSSSSAYSSLLRTELFPQPSDKGDKGRSSNSFSPMTPGTNTNIFRFRAGGGLNSRSESPYALSPVGDDSDLCSPLPILPKTSRKIAKIPYKVLDAPGLQDDFYLNLVEWSSHNILAVGLGSCVYLWSACSSRVTKLCDLGPDDNVCSVAWTQRGTYLSVGTNSGEVQIWDAAKCRQVRTLVGHRTRVGVLAWNSNMLSSGSRDRTILQRDIRAQEDFVSRLLGHKSEVCGLKWSSDNRELASGGNDNQLLVWTQQSTEPLLRFSDHKAAVKAIAWSPHQHGLLASGGGTADRCLRFWNTSTGSQLNCIDTGSQVCNLIWSKNVNELVSTHGYSQNQIIVWRYPKMSKITTLTGHTLRVLYLAISPDGQTIVTGAGDETLRFWNVFPSPKSQSTIHNGGVWSSGRTNIR
eukprot:TRINITY_DN11924_c0_g1_i2.p1 TRINITY_DN11924_c0_g1~~TRINITY_DN11924_c0_g1_i2.p1  ORF type:complete len:516 (+),score=61.42 TRINITY_DN11924_c0_g1_i2:115-1662(+)